MAGHQPAVRSLVHRRQPLQSDPARGYDVRVTRRPGGLDTFLDMS
jgi:hypothetical protein